MRQQQIQHPGNQQGKRHKRRLWVRWSIVIAVLLVVAVVSIGWLVNTRGPWFGILPIIIFTVLGTIIALFQWLFPVSSSDPEHHGIASLAPHGATMAPVVPPIIVQVPATTQPLPAITAEKAAYRGIVGFPPPTDSRTIQQREKVVKEVYAKLLQPDITAIVLTGIGGVGKSTLAALIHRYAEEQRRLGRGPFSAGALWLRIDPAVTMADLAGTLLEALGKPLLDFGDLTPQNLAVALFNALNTTEQARLIVLDQFENLLDAQTGYALADHAGVGELLDVLNSQPCRCRVLLTSRLWPQGTREYPPTYMQEYHIRGLEIAEGIELLRKQGVGGEVSEADLRMAVEYCAGHAFALTLLASFLRRNRSLSLAALFTNPTYARLWTGNIARNLLDSIYQQQLNEMQRRLLLAFSIYREPVALDAAQALLDSSAEAPENELLPALDVLLRQHLLQAAGEGRYQLHAIVADYARSRFAGTGEQEALRAAHSRAARYYLQHAKENCPPRPQRHQNSDVHDFVEAAWHKCQAGQWQVAYELMQQEELFADLNRWGGNAILLELYELLLPVEKWHPSRVQEARLYNNLGAVCRALGQMSRARGYLEQALDICREEGDRHGEGWALNNLGRVYSIMGDREQARGYFEQALQLYRELGDRTEEVFTMNNLAGVYRAMVQRQRAREYCEQALHIARETGDREEEAVTLNNLGEVYSALGKWEKAQGYYEQALKIQRETGSRVEEGWTLNNLGKLYDVMGQLEQARTYLEQALSIRREVGDRLGEGRTLKNLGKVYDQLGQKEQALAYLEQALNLCKDLDRWGEGKTLNALGAVYAGLGQTEQALTYFEQALRIRREIRDRNGEATTLDYLGRVYSESGQKERAIPYYRQAVMIRREVEDSSGEGIVLCDMGLLYLKCGEYAPALACFLQAKRIFSASGSEASDLVQRSIDELSKQVGQERFQVLLAEVEPQVEKMIEDILQAK